jgi:hypothetical protein
LKGWNFGEAQDLAHFSFIIVVKDTAMGQVPGSSVRRMRLGVRAFSTPDNFSESSKFLVAYFSIFLRQFNAQCNSRKPLFVSFVRFEPPKRY